MSIGRFHIQSNKEKINFAKNLASKTANLKWQPKIHMKLKISCMQGLTSAKSVQLPYYIENVKYCPEHSVNADMGKLHIALYT